MRCRPPSGPAGCAPMATAQSAAFVGRDHELGILTTALDRAKLGTGGLIAVPGPAGIGKTRLAEELTGRAAEGGFVPPWGAAGAGGGAPPLWPRHDLLTPLRTAGNDDLPAPPPARD